MARSSPASRRYAEALVDAAESKGKAELDRVKKEITDIASSMEGVFDLKNVLLNPVFTQQERDVALGKLMEQLSLSETSQRFLRLLVEKDRIGQLDEIAEVVQRLADEREGRVRAEIRSATPLAPDQADRLRKALEKKTGKLVTLDQKLDPTVIGGIQAKIGSQVFDGTLRAELEKLRGILEAQR